MLDSNVSWEPHNPTTRKKLNSSTELNRAQVAYFFRITCEIWTGGLGKNKRHTNSKSLDCLKRAVSKASKDIDGPENT